MKKLSNIEKYLLTGLGVYVAYRILETTTSMVLKKKEFVDKMLPIAKRIKNDFDIPSIITITQSAHESGWGTSKLTVIANNLFGFTKGSSWTGDIIELPTTEYVNGKKIIEKRAFRKYPSLYESARDWAVLISTKSRYKKSYTAAKTGNLNNFADAIGQSGYATDPKYSAKIVSVGNSVREVMQA